MTKIKALITIIVLILAFIFTFLPVNLATCSETKLNASFIVWPTPLVTFKTFPIVLSVMAVFMKAETTSSI